MSLPISPEEKRAKIRIPSTVATTAAAANRETEAADDPEEINTYNHHLSFLLAQRERHTYTRIYKHTQLYSFKRQKQQEIIAGKRNEDREREKDRKKGERREAKE